MTRLIGKQAAIIGAGMGGLAAAKAVAPFFEKVIVLDRDALPDTALARLGTPQARHAHVLLAGGSRALESLFPGFESELLRAGAIKTQLYKDCWIEMPGYDPLPRRDVGFAMMCQTRPLLEWTCRNALEREPNVEIRSRSRVIGLMPSADLEATVGVQVAEGDALRTIPADLIIDASGRATPTLAFLDAIACPRPVESEIGIDMAYSTLVCEAPRNGPDWNVFNHLPAKPHALRGGVVARAEGGRWIISLGGAHGDPPPDNIDGFKAFAGTLRTPTLRDAIESAKPLGGVVRFNLPGSVLRHFDKIERFPRGLIPLGDSICRFNPVFGQGMSVAAQEAVALGRILEGRRRDADPLAGLASAFFAEAEASIEAPWAVAMSDFGYPQTRGDRPPDLEKRAQFQAGLLRLMVEDPEVQKLAGEVNHLLKPRSALRDPDLVRRVMAVLQPA